MVLHCFQSPYRTGRARRNRAGTLAQAPIRATAADGESGQPGRGTVARREPERRLGTGRPGSSCNAHSPA